MQFPEPPTPSPEAPPSRQQVVVTEALRRRALALANRRLPTIIRAARYEELEQLLDLFFWFGSPAAMRLELPEGQRGTPGLTLEESNARVRLRIKRGECFAPFGNAEPENPPPDNLTAAEAAPCPPAGLAPGATAGLYRIFKHGRMWFVDRTTGKIVSPAPL